MTPEELQAIKERANNATPGTWAPTQDPLTHPRGYEIEGPDTYIVAECCGYTGSISSEADAEFIAHARTDIPNLLNHIDTLTVRLAAVRNVHRRWNRGRQDSVCSHCYENTSPMPTPTPWPCPTIRTLEGDPDA